MSASRDAERILRFLRRGDAACEPAVSGKVLILDGGERGKIAVDRSAVAAMLQAGTVKVRKGRISLVTGNAPRADALGAAMREMDTASILLPEGVREIAVNANESPLAQLHRRKNGAEPFLSDAEFLAGERLRSDYQRACIMPRLGANWEASVAGRRRSSNGGSIVELTDAVLAARQRVERALKHVGPELSGVLIDVCCFLKGMETVEAERRWPARSAKLILKAALGTLTRHYEPARTRNVRMLHWGAQDYRPSVGA